MATFPPSAGGLLSPLGDMVRTPSADSPSRTWSTASYAAFVPAFRRCSPRIGSGPGWSVEQAARRLGVSQAIYRELEAGTRPPAWETFDRICKTFGWPQTFVG
jgi:Helix-turn-helix domain